MVTPTVAFGKGWHNFDVQSTFGVSVPTADSFHFGHPILCNTAFQYRVLKKLWPEVEVNATFWPDGTNDGKKQVFLTPGIVIGRFPIRNRLGFTVGGGVQVAATNFHQYNHNWILSLAGGGLAYPLRGLDSIQGRKSNVQQNQVWFQFTGFLNCC